MKYPLLQKLRKKLYFTLRDAADILGIKPKSARVLCSRYVKKGLFIRLKKNFYVLEQNWVNFSKEQFLRVSNFLQVPSYVSFTTALSFYGLTTQVQRDFFESACLKRSIAYNIKGAIFNFYKLNRKYYFSFIKRGDLFIATKEKAFIDAVYLYSFGKYKFDIEAIDFKKLDKKEIKKIIKAFPPKTKNLLKKLCKI